jgi:signal transduction histidine kinase
MKTLTLKTPHKKNEYKNTKLPPLQAETSGLVPPRSALINSQGDIVAVDTGWKSLAESTRADWKRIGPGANYLDVCRNACAVYNDAASAFRGVKAVLAGRIPAFSMNYRCHTPSGWSSFRMTVTRIDHGEARACVSHIDVTALALSNDRNTNLTEQFARRAIHAQEEERKRISQKIHDDLGNRIALLALSARQITKENRENPDSISRERKQFFDQITDFANALRDLSHSLHPPLLRYVGIKGALTTLRETFHKLHGIRVNLFMPVELPRLSEELALCIFRIAQESLQNVAKHSGADAVTVALGLPSGSIRLTVSDTGRGFTKSEAILKGGIGLLVMESRAVSLGGTLIVNSSPGAGTKVALTLPLKAEIDRGSITFIKEYR